MPRQRNVPRRYEIGSSVPETSTSVEAFYRQTYYEVIDYVVHAIRSICSRFDRDGYKTLSRLKQLMCDHNENVTLIS